MSEESPCSQERNQNEEPLNDELAAGQEPMQANTLAPPGGEEVENEEEDDDVDAPVTSATGLSEDVPADNTHGAEGTASAPAEEEPVLVEDDPGHEEPAPPEPSAPLAADDEPAPSEACDKETESVAVVPFDSPRRSKRLTQGGVQEKQAKRPRWGDKAFEDITMGDVEAIVKKCNSLEKKVEVQTEKLAQLEEVQSEKKDLEKQLSSVTPEMVARTKASIAKQFLSQMVYVSAWNVELKKSSRSISAFLPNVTVELLYALGGDTGMTRNKRSQYFFEKPPTKNVPMPTSKSEEKPAGSALVLGPYVTLKYIKTHEELQASTTYLFGVPAGEEKSASKGRGRGRGRGKARGKGRSKTDEAEDQPGDQPGELSDGNVSDAADELKDGHVLALGGQ